MDKNKKQVNFLYEAYNSIKKHWFIYTIITFVPTIWFTLITNYLGIYIGLIEISEGQKKFTLLGKYSTGFIIVIPLVINCFNNWYSSKSEASKIELLQFEKDYNAQLVDSADNICQKKLESLNGIIANIYDNGKQIPHIVSDPHKQLTTILEEINRCLCIFLSNGNVEFKPKDFKITLAYNFPKNDDLWCWTEGTVERCLSLQELTCATTKSSFNYILSEKRPYYFNNSKEDAEKEGKYYLDENDKQNIENGISAGSICCCKFQMKSGKNTFINAIVSVSTNCKRFVEVDSSDKPKDKQENKRRVANARENIIGIVKENFGKRIGIEIRLLYLDYLYKNRV